MAWSVIRKATEEDYEALEKAARRFIARHSKLVERASVFTVVEEQQFHKEDHRRFSYVDYLESAIDTEEDHDPWGDYKYLRMLWLRCVRRALNEPEAEGISWDTVGYHVD